MSLLLFTSALYAQNIKLPTPNKSGGKPLMTVLNERKSSRDFLEVQLPSSIIRTVESARIERIKARIAKIRIRTVATIIVLIWVGGPKMNGRGG